MAADEKLRLAASLLARSLRPGGVNPLAHLYEYYSKGIHSESDAECLETGILLRNDFRDDFDYVFKNLRLAVDEAKQYAVRITKRT